MADPWTNDVSALGERTRVGLRPMDATRALIQTISNPEPKMRLFKQRPALAALIVLAVLMLFAPVAYAIVDRVLLSIDPEMSAPEIEEDLELQLEAAGVKSTVSAEKSDGMVKIQIDTDDDKLGSNLDVVVPDHPNANALALRLEVACKLTDDQELRLQQTVTGRAFLALIATRPGSDLKDQTDAQLAAQLRQALATGGFHDADVTVGNGSISVVVKAPPR